MQKTLTVIGLSMAFGLGHAPAAYASQWGCTVLLCLAGNWNDIDQCRPPVEKLFENLALGDEFPGCDMSDGNDSSSNYVKQGTDPVQDCPAGYPVQTEYVPVDEGGYTGQGFQGVPAHRTCRTQDQQCSWYTPAQIYGQETYSIQLPPSWNWTTNYDANGDRQACGYNYFTQTAKRSDPAWIDVYVNGQVYNRVWWQGAP